MSEKEALAQPRRLSKRGVVIYAWQGMRQLGSFGSLIAIVALLNNYAWIAGVLLLMAAIYGLAAWWRFLFFVSDENELIVTSGVFGRKRVVVPLGRVSSVDLQQNILHRVLRVVAVEIETAGSTSTEVSLPAVSPAIGEALRHVCAEQQAASRKRSAAITDQDQTSAAPDGSQSPLSAPVAADRVALGSADNILVHRTPSELLLLAVTSPLDLSPIGLIGVFFFGAGLLEDIFDISTDSVEEGIFDWFGGPSTFMLAAALFIAASLVTRLARTVVTFFDYTLWRSPTGVRSAAGLLSRAERAAAFGRIQTATERQNPIQRRFDLAILELSLAAAGVLDAGKKVTIPGATSDEQAKVLATTFSANPLATPRPHPIDSYARRRWLFYSLIAVTLFVTVPTLLVFAAMANEPAMPEFPSLTVVMVATAIWLVATATCAWLSNWRWRSWHWGISDEFISIQSRWYSTETVGFAVSKVQSVAWHQTWGQRRAGVATVQIATAGDSIEIPHVPLTQAGWARDLLLYRAETDPRPPL